ncbi:hypothetical protein ACFWIJ_46165, partial [Streptomyces sp. NPDC127079]
MNIRGGMFRAVIVAGSVLLAAGCGGHGSANAEKASVKASDATAASADRKSAAMTRAQLDGAVIADGDAAGWKVSVPKSASGPVGGQRMCADKAACQPVADALSETRGGN